MRQFRRWMRGDSDIGCFFFILIIIFIITNSRSEKKEVDIDSKSKVKVEEKLDDKSTNDKDLKIREAEEVARKAELKAEHALDMLKNKEKDALHAKLELEVAKANVESIKKTHVLVAKDENPKFSIGYMVKKKTIDHTEGKILSVIFDKDKNCHCYTVLRYDNYKKETWDEPDIERK